MIKVHLPYWTLVGPKKIKFWDKTAALNMAMRHFGLFKRNNRKQA